MRRSIAAALCTGAALTLSACGKQDDAAPPTVPLTFSITTTTPTSTVPTPASSPTIGPNGVPVETGPFLAPASTTTLGAIVKGIQCESLPQLAYTAYAHLQVYVRGKSRTLPGGIGLVGKTPKPTPNGLYFGAKTCMYWLHTRAADGVIEIQSPAPRHYTLGDFFHVWRQPLTRRRAATATGPITAIVDGRRWRGRPANIPLEEHTEIELAVGRPVPAQRPTVWLGTGL